MQHQIPALAPARDRGWERGEAGFTLVELTIALIVVVELIVAVLLLFDSSAKLGKVQMQVTEMQQGVRSSQYEIVRMLRMAGRGELPVTNNPGAVLAPDLFAGTSVALRNNVPAGSGVIAGAAPTDPPAALTNPRVLAGTDILTVRGVFTTPLYQVNAADSTAFSFNLNQGTGMVTIKATSPTGVPQPFDSTNAPGSFGDACGSPNSRPESLILVSPVDDTIYGVAQLDCKSSDIGQNDPNVARIGFTIATTAAALSAGATFPTNLQNVAFVGILEEYRYYVREAHLTPSDLTSPLDPNLSRARLYAGTDTAWNGDVANLAQDVAQGIRDLQIALGFDLNAPSAWSQSATTAPTYLFDSPADNATSKTWSPLPNPFPQLFYVRVNVFALTSRHDVHYQAPVIVSIEDHVYPTPASSLPDDPNGSNGLSLRRRYVQTVVDLRNRL